MCLHRRTEVAKHNFVILLREYCWSVCMRSDFSNCWEELYKKNNNILHFYVYRVFSFKNPPKTQCIFYMQELGCPQNAISR